MGDPEAGSRGLDGPKFTALVDTPLCFEGKPLSWVQLGLQHLYVDVLTLPALESNCIWRQNLPTGD